MLFQRGNGIAVNLQDEEESPTLAIEEEPKVAGNHCGSLLQRYFEAAQQAGEETVFAGVTTREIIIIIIITVTNTFSAAIVIGLAVANVMLGSHVNVSLLQMPDQSHPCGL